MMLDARDELAAEQRQSPWTLRVVEGRLALPVQEAPMNMRAVPGSVRFGNRREAHALSQPEGNRLGEFAGDHGVIGGPPPERRRRGDFELLRPELRQK